MHCAWAATDVSIHSGAASVALAAITTVTVGLGYPGRVL